MVFSTKKKKKKVQNAAKIGWRYDHREYFK